METRKVTIINNKTQNNQSFRHPVLQTLVN